MGGATIGKGARIGEGAISIHAPHAGSDNREQLKIIRKLISTHTPHAGSDGRCVEPRYRQPGISIHAPHGGATGPRTASCCSLMNFNPRSPCGERWRRDRSGPYPPPTYFYPCSPCGERHGVSAPVIVDNAISIHAPHAGSDMCSAYHRQRWYDFYPRSPCGERLPRHTIAAVHLHFYPRSPCGERLSIDISHHRPRNFYPRSPCGERRRGNHPRDTVYGNLYPRSPWGERRFPCHCLLFGINFYPRSPWGSDGVDQRAHHAFGFLSTLPMGGATASINGHITRSGFLSTLPMGGATKPRGCLSRMVSISIHAPHGGSDPT